MLFDTETTPLRHSGDDHSDASPNSYFAVYSPFDDQRTLVFHEGSALPQLFIRCEHPDLPPSLPVMGLAAFIFRAYVERGLKDYHVEIKELEVLRVLPTVGFAYTEARFCVGEAYNKKTTVDHLATPPSLGTNPRAIAIKEAFSTNKPERISTNGGEQIFLPVGKLILHFVLTFHPLCSPNPELLLVEVQGRLKDVRFQRLAHQDFTPPCKMNSAVTYKMNASFYDNGPMGTLKCTVCDGQFDFWHPGRLCLGCGEAVHCRNRWGFPAECSRSTAYVTVRCS